VVEESVIEPTPADILRLRKEAESRIIHMGADPASVEVQIEIEAKRKVVRATAIGALAMRKKDHAQALTRAERLAIAAESMHLPLEEVNLEGATSLLAAFRATLVKKKFLGIMKTVRYPVRVIDEDGVVRLSNPDGKIYTESREKLPGKLPQLMYESSKFGDGGQSIPDVYLLVGGKIINFAGLSDTNQITALAEAELSGYDNREEIVVVMGMKDV